MITSPKNSRIKAAQRLHRKRHRQQAGTLLLEGVRLIRDALSAGIAPHTVFYAPDIVGNNAAAQGLLHDMASMGEHLACTDAVFRSLTDTVTPQGIAALVPLPALPFPAELTFTLILDQVREPGNAGTLLRSAEAAGADAVIFGPNTVDPFNDKVVRAAMGAHFRLPLQTCVSWAEADALLRGDQRLYLAEANASTPYDAIDWQQSVALVVGGEANGASADARADTIPIAIPMQSATESLNAAIAGAVILFEAARQRRQHS